MTRALESQFHEAMLSIYERAKTECGYNATRFLRMVNDHGGLQASRILLHEPSISEGFTALWERGRLDLSMEVMILKSHWNELFTEEERNIAQRRLSDANYQVDGRA